VSTPERSLYLYFLDRELGDAVGYRLDPLVARHAVQTLTIATNARLVCGLSLLYENDNLDPPAIGFFGQLLEAGVLDTISHYPSYAEFLASRVTLYRHDAERYPAYFGKLSLPALNPTVVKAGGTTERIVEGMSQWALRLPDNDRRYRLTAGELSGPVLRALREREDRAVTFSLFRQHLGELADVPAAQWLIRRAISRLFATDYRDFGGNDVPTGMRGLTFFEEALALDFPCYDVQILSHLIRLSGLADALATGRPDSGWDALLYARESDGHTMLAAVCRWIISAFAGVVAGQPGSLRHDEVRFRIITWLRRLVTPPPTPARPAGLAQGDVRYEIAQSNALALASQLRGDRRIAEALDRLHDDFFPPAQADVLLVVATQIEADAVFDVFASNGYAPARPSFSLINTYQLFAPVAGARIALVRCSMGAGGPGGPELTVAEAITALKPASVIMLGIAFGTDRRTQRVGDVLLSTRVFDYELQRAGTDPAGRLVRVSRGDRPVASPRLIGRFQMARLHTFGLTVHEGTMLSGRKLVDNVDYRDQLTALCPEAIGGEMEGYGVYAAAQRHSVDWVIVKAICDWADGRKRNRKAHRQNVAAANAALAVLRTLERGGFAP
jgi:nucleoside phosphorylase